MEGVGTMKRLYIDVTVKVNGKEKKGRLEISLPENEMVVIEIPGTKLKGLTQSNSQHTLSLIQDQKVIEEIINRKIEELNKLKEL